MFMVELQQTDSYKQLERLLACLPPYECTEGCFQFRFRVIRLSAQMCIQRVLDKLYEVFEVVVLLEKHRGIKLFRLTVLAKQC